MLIITVKPIRAINFLFPNSSWENKIPFSLSLMDFISDPSSEICVDVCVCVCVGRDWRKAEWSMGRWVCVKMTSNLKSFMFMNSICSKVVQKHWEGHDYNSMKNEGSNFLITYTVIDTMIDSLRTILFIFLNPVGSLVQAGPLSAFCLGALAKYSPHYRCILHFLEEKCIFIFKRLSFIRSLYRNKS